MTDHLPVLDGPHAALALSLVVRRDEHTSGLSIRRRTAEVVVADASRVAVHISTDADDIATGRTVSWREAHMVAVDESSKTASQVPADRIRAVRQGAALRWPGPSARTSTRLGAAAVRTLARRRGSVADDPVTVVDSYIQLFKNQQRFTVFPRLFGPNFTHHFDFPGRGPGLDSFMSVGRDLLGAFTELHVDVLDLFGQGGLVVESNVVNARHTGTFAGVPATGRAVTWTEIHFYRVVDGRIVENWPTVDVEHLIGRLR